MQKITLPEITSAGIYNSSIAVKNRVETKKRKTTMFEIEIAAEDGGISFVDSKSTPITPNLLICAKPGQTRYTKLPFVCYYVHLCVNEGPVYDMLMKLPNYFKTDRRKFYVDLFSEFIRRYEFWSTDNEVVLQSLLLKLIYEIYEESIALQQSKSLNQKNHLAIDKVLHYIDENLSTPLDLESVASHFSFSPNYFHQIFKAATGTRLRSYIEEQRIRKAIHLLQSTNYTLSQIAMECGFSSQAYFSCVFKKRMGLTPREYTKEIYKKYHL